MLPHCKNLAQNASLSPSSIDKRGKPKLIVATHFIYPTWISGQTIKCTVLSCPGSLQNHRSVGRQTVKHAMFMMIYVVQSYEINCIYNAHQCGVIWKASAEFCLPAWRKRYCQKVGKGIYVLESMKQIYAFYCDSRSGSEAVPHLTTCATHLPFYPLLKICHMPPNPQGVQYRELYMTGIIFFLMQKTQLENMLLSNKTIKVCILHIHSKGYESTTEVLALIFSQPHKSVDNRRK